MRVYVFLCHFYAFYDVILYNFDVFPEFHLCVLFLLDLLVLLPDPFIQLIDILLSVYVL